MPEEIKVALVDDTKTTLDSLTLDLEEFEGDIKFQVFPYKNPYQALDVLQKDNFAFEFIFIDHQMNVPKERKYAKDVFIKSGIDLTEHVSRINSHIGIVVYSADPHTTSEERWEALAKGAHRYIYQGDLIKLTSEFIQEIRELRQLYKALQDFYKGRQKVGVVSKGLDVAIDLIDRDFKVWFTNDDFDRLVGDSGTPHKFCCSRFHDRDWPPCPGCLVVHALSGIHRDRIFYSPVYPNGKKIYKYLHVWVDPVYSDEKEKIKPIAATETVIDITNSDTIKTLKLKDHLDIVMKSVTELTPYWIDPKQVSFPEDGDWERALNNDRRPRYERVRVYRVEKSKKGFIVWGIHKISDEPPGNFEDFCIHPTKYPISEKNKSGNFKTAVDIENHREYIPQEVIAAIRMETIHCNFALFSPQGEWIGWLEIDSENSNRSLTQKDADFLLPYSEEISKILYEKLGKEAKRNVSYSNVLESIRAKVSLAKNPEDALQIVLKELVENVDGIDMGHVRLKKGKYTEMVTGVGEYYKVARKKVSVNDPDFGSIISIHLGRPIFTILDEPRMERTLKKMSQEAREIYKKHKSHAAFPLVFEGDILGAMSLQGLKENVFSDEITELCQRAASIASLALHDFNVSQEVEKHVEETWNLAAAQFAHRLGNIIPIVQNRVKIIQKSVAEKSETHNHCDVALREIRRSFEIIKYFKKYVSKIEPDMKEENIGEIIDIIVERCKGLSLDINVIKEDVESVIKVDWKLLSDVFVSLMYDSIKHHPSGIPNITIGSKKEEKLLNEAILFFSDNGNGIPYELKAKIFQPFFTTSPKGNGIGLSYDKRVINAMEGEIKETGKPGEGAFFEIRFKKITREE